MKPTITSLALYLKVSQNSLYHMRKTSPRKWALLWDGWLELLKKKE